MAGVNHKIHVYQDSDGEFRVYPPVLLVDAANGAGNRDDVEFVNHTAEDMVFFAGPGVFAATAEGAPAAKNGGKSGAKKSHSSGAGQTKLHTYQVFMVQSGKKAKGNSDPILIIDN